MHLTQSRALPERIYEPNIAHNPLQWMGIWTPQGWRIHRKRWGRARRITRFLSGDGTTTFFPETLLDPQAGRVEWQDDLHLEDDPFTDGGIYPCDPRVEYPPGVPRWAVSHTLLCHPVADHNLYTHQYTWDMLHGHLQTYFRTHVTLEEARTDSLTGRTVCISHRPISRTIEGNVHYPLPNSAVRGVWANAEKTGKNLYARRMVRLIRMHNSAYAIAPRHPVVQCHGMYAVLDADPTHEIFDGEGECRDWTRAIEQLRIPLDEPRIGMLTPPYRKVPSRLYQTTICMMAADEAVVQERDLGELRRRRGAQFCPGLVGYAAQSHRRAVADYDGYHPRFDLNNNGIIDEEDEQRFARHVGRRVRYNAYLDAYFGGDWLTTQVCQGTVEHEPGARIIADYEYGAGYDAQSGTIRLRETPGPDQPVWVEYFYDAPAAVGENNIRLHLYRES